MHPSPKPGGNLCQSLKDLEQENHHHKLSILRIKGVPKLTTLYLSPNLPGVCPGTLTQCCAQIVRPPKTTQESEVVCKNKEPLFRVKLWLSDLTDAADLCRQPHTAIRQGFY
jgi:hypothetical protein